MLVDVERGRTVKGWKPRRLGGGLGGRVEKKKAEPYAMPPPAALPAPVAIAPTPGFSSSSYRSSRYDEPPPPADRDRCLLWIFWSDWIIRTTVSFILQCRRDKDKERRSRSKDRDRRKRTDRHYPHSSHYNIGKLEYNLWSFALTKSLWCDNFSRYTLSILFSFNTRIPCIRLYNRNILIPKYAFLGSRSRDKEKRRSPEKSEKSRDGRDRSERSERGDRDRPERSDRDKSGRRSRSRDRSERGSEKDRHRDKERDKDRERVGGDVKSDRDKDGGGRDKDRERDKERRHGDKDRGDKHRSGRERSDANGGSGAPSQSVGDAKGEPGELSWNFEQQFF